MNPKKEDQKIQTNKIVPKKSGNNLTNTNSINNPNTSNNNTINNKKNSTKDSRQYNVQLTILDQSKKLKIV